MIEVRPPHDFEAALRAARMKHCDAVLLLFSLASWTQRQKIPPVAERTGFRSCTEPKLRRGRWTLSYSPVLSATFVVRRTSLIVCSTDGPRELPVEQTTKVHLAVNLKPRRHWMAKLSRSFCEQMK